MGSVELHETRAPPHTDPLEVGVQIEHGGHGSGEVG
jgi:hypothetical protein